MDSTFYAGAALTAPFLLLGLYDLLQRRHGILRNYPVLGHVRFLLEGAGPELHQYFVEGASSGRPFDRDARTLMYRRAKDLEGLKPFGTELDGVLPAGCGRRIRPNEIRHLPDGSTLPRTATDVLPRPL